MNEIKDLDSILPEHKTTTIPLGYIPIELSTQGKLGVPKILHCRNFSTSDLVGISMFNEEILPERIIDVLNSLIYEKVNVADFPDRVIIELIIRIYINYFTPILQEIVFPWDDTDIKWLEDREQTEKVNELKSGKWIPKIDLDLRRVRINYLDSDVKPYITVKKKNSQGNVIFEVKFISYPKYGDVITLRKAVETKFVEEEKRYSKIRQAYQIRERYISEGRDISNFEPINDRDYLQWQLYEATRAKYAAKVAEALYLVKYNEIDLSKVSLEEKIKYIDSPLFDVHLSKAVEDMYSKLDFGINPEVEIKNPITGEMCKRRFSFRFLDLLQALQSSKPYGYDISFDD